MNVYDMIVKAVNEVENFDNALTLNNYQQGVVNPFIIHLCPYCGESYYAEQYSTRTCVGWAPIYKDGVLINHDPNVTTTYCHCLNCGEDFSFEC